MRKKALFVTLVLALLAGLVGFSATPAHAAPLAFGGPSACYWGGDYIPSWDVVWEGRGVCYNGKVYNLVRENSPLLQGLVPVSFSPGWETYHGCIYTQSWWVITWAGWKYFTHQTFGACP